MANSSLQRTGEKPPTVDKGHGTEALGPSDSSDTGSDITGAPGLNRDGDALPLQHGTTSDLDHNVRSSRKTAGPDIGDENLDSDTDSGGTGERAAAGRDAPAATDQQLKVIDAFGNETMSDEQLQQELVEEDLDYGSEGASDVMSEPATPRRRNKQRGAVDSRQGSKRRPRGGASKRPTRPSRSKR